MKRKIIEIKEDLCNGCGDCIPNCPEGALQVIDGKVRLISDLFCDGLGACIGHCPTGAIEVVEREAQSYDERRVMQNIIKQGAGTIKAHLEHLQDHGETEMLETALKVLAENNLENPLNKSHKPGSHSFGGCPGSRTVDMRKDVDKPRSAGADVNIGSELRQWPVQLTLVNPNAPYFENSELLVAADCVPFAYANFHQKFLKDKAVVIFCPKLDTNLDEYTEKLAAIFTNRNVKSVTVLNMEVPCCFGTGKIVSDAIRRSGKTIPLANAIITLQGEIKQL